MASRSRTDVPAWLAALIGWCSRRVLVRRVLILRVSIAKDERPRWSLAPGSPTPLGNAG
jgi:hypothetical protein